MKPTPINQNTFTQLDTKGARGDLRERFENVVNTLSAMPIHLLGFLASYHNLPMSLNEKNMSETILKHFNQEVLEDIGALFMLMGSC